MTTQISGRMRVYTFTRTMYRVIATSTLEQRLAWLEDSACITRACFSHI